MLNSRNSDHTVLQYFSINSRGGIHPSAGNELIAFVNRINKMLVDNSVPRNTEKSTKYAGTIRALELRNCRGVVK